MYQLVESVCIENKILNHIELHNQRFNQSGRELFGWTKYYDLREIITLPESISDFRHKCRVVTNGNNFEVEISPYTQRKINTLKVVYANSIDYTHKTTDRTMLDWAYQQRENADDILIVKNGNLTDSWAANILLFDGISWFTPDTPLLKGTQREFLILTGRVKEKRITINDLMDYQSIRLVNAMISFEKSDLINISTSVFI